LTRLAHDLRDQLIEIERGVAVRFGEGPAVLRLVGPDRVEALNRVVSQDVRTLPVGAGRLALLLAPKGQFRALMGVVAGSEELWLLAPPGREDTLRAGLGRYLAFSRSTLEPAGSGAVAVLVLGPRWTEVAAAAGAAVDVLAAGGCSVTGSPGEDVHWFGQTLQGVPGTLAHCSTDVAAAGVELLARSLGACPAGAAAVELARIRVGFPAWGRELTETVLPAEVGIEPAAVSYTKGCYVGQETVARMRTYGHANRCLVGVRQRDGSAATPELPVPLVAVGEEKPRGTLTSLAFHPDIGGVGLALVRRELAAEGTCLRGDGRTFEITPLPLW
jgi:tRNA-modifying protein YgfZ